MKKLYNLIKNLYYKIISNEKVKLFRYKVSTSKIGNINPVHATTFLVLFTIICISVGYSAFGTNLNMTGTVVTVRPVFDVRVQNVTPVIYNNLFQLYKNTDYNKDRIISTVTFKSSVPIQYQVTVVNIGNTDIGINKIDIKDKDGNELSNISYTLSGYTLKDSLNIKNGNTTTFNIKLNSSIEGTYDLNIIFDFQQFYSVTYEDIDASSLPSKVLGGDTLNVDFSDNKPGEINVKMGDSLTDAYTMKNTGEFSLAGVSGDIVFSKVAIKGTPTYFNVSTGNYCTENDYRQSFDYENYKDYLNSMTGYNGIETSSSVQNSCLKFYKMHNYSSLVVDFMLDHNIATGVDFNSSGSTTSGPGTGSTEALGVLKSKTSSWKGTTTPEDYMQYMTFTNTDISSSSTKIEYTIPYSSGGYKARLVTTRELIEHTNSSWFKIQTAKGYNSYFYYDNDGTNYQTQKLPSDGVSKYGYLYDRLNNCKDNGCYYNSITPTNSTGSDHYYTSTASYWHASNVWGSNKNGMLYSLPTSGSSVSGVRPVMMLTLKHPSLPDAYQQVEYIQMTGTQWIDTGHKADGYTGIAATFQFTSTTPTQQVLFGSGSSGGLVYAFYINGGGGWSYSYNNNSGNWVAILNGANTNKHSIEFNITRGKMTFDTQREFTLSGTTNTTLTVNNIYIGSYKNASSLGAQNAKVKIYKFDVYWSNDLAQRFVPCYRKSDGVIGMYETIEKKFYTNAGTGTFGKGPNVTLTR